jgi:Protein of unknown function (DUF3138)
MRTLKLTTLALALAGAFPTQAADPAADTKKELQALQDRVNELDKQVKALTAAPAPAAGAAAPAGMTDDQLSDFNRIRIKAEGLEDSRDASGLKSLKISGYMDPSYVYNVNKQRGTFQFIVPSAHEAYGYDNSYFGTVSLDFQKETDSGAKFHLNLIPKRGTGDFNDASIVNEASVFVPMDGWKLFFGQLPDWSGYEYQAPAGPTSNLLVTHNLLFDFTLPYFYTGVGAELQVGRVDLKLMLANFNSSIRQVGEHVPMFVFRGDYTPAGTDFWGFGFAGAAGYKNNARPTAVDSGFGLDANGVALDANGNAVSTKDTLYVTGELDAWYTRGDVTFNGHVNYGMQKDAAVATDANGNLQDAWWTGISVLGAYKFTPVFQGVIRADFIYNQKHGGGLLDWTAPDGGNGLGPAFGGPTKIDGSNNTVLDLSSAAAQKGANKYAVTIGVNYGLSTNVILKAEYRLDGSDLAVFGNKDALTGGSDPKFLKYNSLVATSAVFSF